MGIAALNPSYVLVWLCTPIIFAISACASDSTEAMRRFVYWRDRNVAEQENINTYLKPRSGVALESVHEIRPGVMEYSVKSKRWFTADEAQCRFIFVVDKDSATVIGWRYNGKPEYCFQNR
jgi:hypothetical protein